MMPRVHIFECLGFDPLLLSNHAVVDHKGTEDRSLPWPALGHNGTRGETPWQDGEEEKAETEGDVQNASFSPGV